jgi:hypothetical protein
LSLIPGLLLEEKLIVLLACGPVAWLVGGGDDLGRLKTQLNEVQLSALTKPQTEQALRFVAELNGMR